MMNAGREPTSDIADVIRATRDALARADAGRGEDDDAVCGPPDTMPYNATSREDQ